jgi:hypothetical protein
LKGTRPTSNGRHKFESVFVYGFAHPDSGRSRFLILPQANAQCMGQPRVRGTADADRDVGEAMRVAGRPP